MEHSIAGRYKLLEKLSEGSFGKIFKARDITTNNYVAIKIVKLWQNVELGITRP